MTVVIDTCTLGQSCIQALLTNIQTDIVLKQCHITMSW